MNLLILNGPRDPRHSIGFRYRGTYRAHPTYCDSLPREHEINQLFFWFLEEGGEDGVVRDLRRAQRFCQLLNANSGGQEEYEVVEVSDQGHTPEARGLFLGYDLSEGYNNSLLSGGLRLYPGVDRLPSSIRNLLELAVEHYAPQLNIYGLLNTADVALSCLRSLGALQELSSNLFEGGDLKRFQVVALYVIGTGETRGKLRDGKLQDGRKTSSIS